MAASNRDRVRKGLDALRDGLTPFVEREMKRVYGKDWHTQAQAGLPGIARQVQGQMPLLDTSRLLNIVLDHWQPVFKDKLSPFERGVIHELRNARNLWAHEQPISTDDAYRALDNAGRLLQTISAGTQAAEVDRERQDLLRVRFEEQ